MNVTSLLEEPDENGCYLTSEQRKNLIELNAKAWNDALARAKDQIPGPSLEKMRSAGQHPPSPVRAPPSFEWVASFIFGYYGKWQVENALEAKAIAHHIFWLWCPFLNGCPPIEEFILQAGDVCIRNKKALVVYIDALLRDRRQSMAKELGINGQPKVGLDANTQYIGRSEIAPHTLSMAPLGNSTKRENITTNLAIHNNPMAMSGPMLSGALPRHPQPSLGDMKFPYITSRTSPSQILQPSFREDNMPRVSQFQPQQTYLERLAVPYAGPMQSDQPLIGDLTIPYAPQLQGQQTSQGMPYIDPVQSQQSVSGTIRLSSYPSHSSRYQGLGTREDLGSNHEISDVDTVSQNALCTG